MHYYRIRDYPDREACSFSHCNGDDTANPIRYSTRRDACIELQVSTIKLHFKKVVEVVVAGEEKLQSVEHRK